MAEPNAFLDVPPSLGPRVAALATDRGEKRIRWAISVLVALSLGALLLVGSDHPKDPVVLAPHLAGFSAVAYSFSATDNPLCAALADTPEAAAAGLRGRFDIGGFSALAVRYTGDQTTAVTNRGVSFPVSVAYYDASGHQVSAGDLLPCPDEEGCPGVTPAAPYRILLEAPLGSVKGMAAGSAGVLRLGGTCS